MPDTSASPRPTAPTYVNFLLPGDVIRQEGGDVKVMAANFFERKRGVPIWRVTVRAQDGQDATFQVESWTVRRSRLDRPDPQEEGNLDA